MPDATSLRIDGTVKVDLDALQGDVQATGDRVSHSTLIARLVAFAREHEAAFLGARAGWRPPTRAQVTALLREAVDIGEATDAGRDIDATLYGGDA